MASISFQLKRIGELNICYNQAYCTWFNKYYSSNKVSRILKIYLRLKQSNPGAWHTLTLSKWLSVGYFFFVFNYRSSLQLTGRSIMDAFQQVKVCATTHRLHPSVYNHRWIPHRDHYGQLYHLGQAGQKDKRLDGTRR